MKNLIFLLPIMMLPLAVSAGVEKPIALSELPDRVAKAIEQRFPNIMLLSANTEIELNGDKVYEVRGQIPAGQFLDGEYSPLLEDDDPLIDFTPDPPKGIRRVEFDLTPEGDFEEIEIEFSPDLLPGAVRQALQLAYPGFVPIFIEASYSDSMQVVGYELEGHFQGQKLDVELSPSGKDIRIADQ